MMIMMTESSNKDCYESSTDTLCRHYEIRKDSQKYRQRACKNCEKVHFQYKENFQFTNEETYFILFKDLSCILRSTHIFRKYLKCHAFSILATLLTPFQMSCKNAEGRALTQNGLNILIYYQYQYCQSIVIYEKQKQLLRCVFQNSCSCNFL